jgi:hypothetical protein
MSCLDFSSKILNETERPTDVGDIRQSYENSTLQTSPEEKNAYRGSYSLNTQLNPICHLLALLGAHHILHVSRIRVTREIKTVFNIRPLVFSCRV